MKKRYFIWLLFIIVSLFSCTNSQTAEQENETAASTTDAASALSAGVPLEPPPMTIALVMKTLTNPFFVEMEKGARQAEQELGIQLIVKTAAQETSIEQQIEIVDELIHEAVDAIVIAPGDSLELIPVLKKAQDAGIIVINIDNRLDPNYSQAIGLENVPFISVNNHQGAYLSAKYISDQITTPTKVAIIEGIRSAQNAEDRKNGALQAFSENPNVTLVASETANWKIDEGYDVTKALFAAEPEIGAIFCANDMMALGAIQYLKEAGRADVLVAAFDALAEAKEALQAGTLAVTIDQQAAKQGYMGVQYAVQALAGEPLPSETLIDVLVINAANVE
jgi:ribose transport system substrate-binding protein